MPFGLQPLDLIVVVALVIFGPKRLPQLGRWLGKTFSAFRKGARDLTDGFAEETRAQDAAGTGTNTARAGANAAGTATAAADTSADAAAPGAPRESAPGPGAAGTEPEPRPAGIFCTACGASNPADARFCNKCGTRLIA
jgi:sec-independent protein translocase protein TatA